MGKPTNPIKDNIDEANLDTIVQGLDHLEHGISLFNSDLKLQLFNKPFQKLLEYPENFLHIGLAFEDMLRFNIERGEYGEGDPEEQLSQRLEEISKFQHHQFTRLRPNGTYIKVTGSPLPNGGFITTYEDVTREEEVKLQTQDQKEQYQTYLELSPVGAMMTKIDGTILYCNSRFREIFEYSDEEMETVVAQDVYFYPATRSPFVEKILKKTGALSSHFSGKKKNGQEFPILLTSQAIVIKGKQRIFSWIIDLTDLTEAEKTIERLSEHNQMILSAAGAGIFGVDDNDSIQFINPAAANMLGYNENELRDIHLSQLLTDGIETKEQPLTYPARGETEMIRKIGTTFPIKYTISQLEDHSGISGKVIVFDDISERIAAEKVLRQAMQDIEASSQAKSNFLSTMSHELRTPLNAILGFAQILYGNQDSNLNEQQLHFIEHMTHAGEHLLKLINEAIDIAAIENGQVSLSKQAINLFEIIDASITLSDQMTQDKEIHVKNLQKEGAQLGVIADHARLQQIIMHLVSNAIKYNRIGGSVEISAEEIKNHMVRISVKDTGDGIPANQIDDIFEPFNRLQAHSVGIEGTGLGLTLSQKLTQLMGGDIGFSTIEGEGSHFWVDFPKAEKDTPLLIEDEPIS